MSYNPVDWGTFLRIPSPDGRYMLYCSNDLNYGRDEPLYMWTLEKPGPQGNEIPGFSWFEYPESESPKDISEVRFTKDSRAIEIVRKDGSVERRPLPE